jgi:hypothetical protein
MDENCTDIDKSDFFIQAEKENRLPSREERSSVVRTVEWLAILALPSRLAPTKLVPELQRRCIFINNDNLNTSQFCPIY